MYIYIEYIYYIYIYIYIYVYFDIFYLHNMLHVHKCLTTQSITTCIDLNIYIVRSLYIHHHSTSLIINTDTNSQVELLPNFMDLLKLNISVLEHSFSIAIAIHRSHQILSCSCFCLFPTRTYGETICQPFHIGVGLIQSR